MDLGNRVGHYNECDKFERNDTNQLSLHTKIDSEQKWFVSLGYIIFYWVVKKMIYILNPKTKLSTENFNLNNWRMFPVSTTSNF